MRKGGLKEIKKEERKEVRRDERLTGTMQLLVELGSIIKIVNLKNID